MIVLRLRLRDRTILLSKTLAKFKLDIRKVSLAYAMRLLKLQKEEELEGEAGSIGSRLRTVK